MCTMFSPVQSVRVGADGRKNHRGNQVDTELLLVQIASEIRLILNSYWCRHVEYTYLYFGFFGEICNRVS
jgi:hypothetical protein